MKHILQLVSVEVPHPVKIACGKPLCLKYLLRTRAAQRLKQQALELIVRKPILSARADIVVLLPKLLGHIGTTDALQHSAAILYRSPLEHAPQRNVEHDRVEIGEDSRMEYARLPKAHPSAYGGIGDNPFSQRLRDAVMIVGTHAYRVARSAPMKGLASVAHLRNASYIDHFRLMLNGLSQHGIANVGCCRDVDATCLLRPVVGAR